MAKKDHNENYVFGDVAYKLKPKDKQKKRKKVAVKNKPREDLKQKLKIIRAIVFITCMGIYLLTRGVGAIYITRNIQSMENQVQKSQTINDELNEQLSETSNITNIGTTAQKLGMVFPDQKQITYIAVHPLHLIQNDSLNSQRNESIFTKIKNIF